MHVLVHTYTWDIECVFIPVPRLFSASSVSLSLLSTPTSFNPLCFSLSVSLSFSLLICFSEELKNGEPIAIAVAVANTTSHSDSVSQRQPQTTS